MTPTTRDYEQELDANIEDLVERLKGKRYRARAVRRHYIPKTAGKQRPLGIPVVEDKLLQAGVAMILEAIYEPDFLPVSFGYRPGVGARDAVQALGFNLQYGSFGYVVEWTSKDFSPISTTTGSSACCVSVSPTSPSLADRPMAQGRGSGAGRQFPLS